VNPVYSYEVLIVSMPPWGFNFISTKKTFYFDS
jgi:hypothetical protein